MFKQTLSLTLAVTSVFSTHPESKTHERLTVRHWESSQRPAAMNAQVARWLFYSMSKGTQFCTD